MMRSPVQFQVHATERMVKRNRSHGLLMSITDELGRRHPLTGLTDHQLLADQEAAPVTNSTLYNLPFEQNSDNESLALVSSTTRGHGSRWSTVPAKPLISTSTVRPGLDLAPDDTGARIVFELATPPTSNNAPGSEEALLNRSSVLFVAVSFILLMVISLAWLVFYYVQRFRYLHSKERVSRRLAELAKKAVARIPIKTLHAGDRETNSDLDQCAICIEPFRPLDNVRVLPCRHYFHKLCIDPWLLEQRSCPMCKLDILQAYGLRSEFFFGYPNAESGTVGPSRASDGLLNASGLGPVSGSGSDDGMERIALVHSHSRSTQSAATSSSPPLTYVVLTTTTTTSVTMTTTTAGSTVVSMVDPTMVMDNNTSSGSNSSGGTRFYLRGSDASDTANELSIPQPTLQDLPNTAIPLQTSAHNIIVSLLPRLPLSSSCSISSAQSTPPGSLVAWTSELSVTAESQTRTATACSDSGVLLERSNSTSCLVYTISQPPTTVTSSSSGKNQTLSPAITSTTQILIAPLCSVRAESGVGLTTHAATSASGVEGPGECDLIAPVVHMETCAGRDRNFADRTLPGESKHELLYPHRAKDPQRITATHGVAGRLWRKLTHPFRSGLHSRPAAPSPSRTAPSQPTPDAQFPVDMQQIYSGEFGGSLAAGGHSTTEHVVVAVVESVHQTQQHHSSSSQGLLSVIPPAPEAVYPHRHDADDSRPHESQA